MLKSSSTVIGLAASALCLAWVSSAVAPARTLAQGVTRPAGWNESTHGAKATPDYARLFSMDTVHEIRLTIGAPDFEKMQADLKTIGPAGMPALPPMAAGPNGMQALMEAGMAACSNKAPAAACSANGTEGACTAMFGGPLMCVPAAFAKMMQGGGAPNLTSRDPIYVPVTVTHDGRTWTKVGMRYKGNSSLMASGLGANGKVPFRLDFDRYEDGFPETRNQRFYGFQEMTFSSNFSDDSQLREVLGSEIFRDRGVPAPRAAFYKVYVDTGQGSQYWGLYTMVEDPGDGAMLEAQFGSRSGNLYKPDGPGADWTTFNAEGFPKKTNAQQADFSDVRRAIEALHAPQTDPAAWRKGLEAVLDVDGFLRWLAVNTVIENWDVYGALAHNYYLYGDPAQGGRLRWIPWDNNMAFGVGPMGPGRGGFGARLGGAPPPGFPTLPAGGLPPGGFPPGARGAGPAGLPFPGFGGGNDVLYRQVDARWPLIQRLMADSTYATRYRALLKEAMGGLAAPEAAERRMRQLHALIAPAVAGPQGERPSHTTISSAESFERSVDGPDGLIETMRRRRAAITTALSGTTTP